MPEEPYKIGFVGTDTRSLLGSLEVSKTGQGLYRGVVVRGTPAMKPWAEQMGWPVEFIPTADNTVNSYASALIKAFQDGSLNIALILPESLIFNVLVDIVEEAGFGNRIIGPNRKGAFLEDDKIKCKWLCKEAGIPVAPDWADIGAGSYVHAAQICLDYLHKYGGAVMKFPFSAGGKGARVIHSTWDIAEVYNKLMQDYSKEYERLFGENGRWPLLIEALMAGAEISFTVLVDRNGNFQMLPTAMDYPLRFEGPPSTENPVTGGMGAISPHPMESSELIEMTKDTIIRPLVAQMKKRGILRPCVLYPGCFASFDQNFKPTSIRVCEINIRPGEPEFQPIVKLLKNLGPLLLATAEGNLDEVEPEVRDDQISICIALATGPSKEKKGYPWSLRKGEEVKADFSFFKKKGILVLPSAMDYTDGTYKSDGSRVCYVVANATLKPGETRGQAAEDLRQKMYGWLKDGRIRVESSEGDGVNRLAYRSDIGSEYQKSEPLHSK